MRLNMVSRLGLCDKRCTSYLCIATRMIMNVSTSFPLSHTSPSGERDFLVSPGFKHRELVFEMNLSHILNHMRCKYAVQMYSQYMFS